MAEEVWDSRRAFLGKAVVGGFAFSLPILYNGSSARADAYGDCLANAYNEYQFDRMAASLIANSILRGLALAAARTAYAARQAACAALAVGRGVVATASATKDWIDAHPGAVIGTVVVIGGVAFIVTGGAAGLIYLAPAAAAIAH